MAWYLTWTCKPTNEGWSDSLWPLTFVTGDADMLWDGDQDSCSLQWCRHPGGKSEVLPFALVALCSSLLTYVAILLSLAPSLYLCFSWLIPFSRLPPPFFLPPSFPLSLSLLSASLFPFLSLLSPLPPIISTPSFPLLSPHASSSPYFPTLIKPPPSLSAACSYGRWGSEGRSCCSNRELPQHGGYTVSHRGDWSTSSKFTSCIIVM